MKLFIISIACFALFTSALQAQPVFGYTTFASDSIVRPNNATQYAAGDILNDSTGIGTGSGYSPKVLVFRGIGRKNGYSGYITAVQMLADTSASTAVILHIYADSNAIPRTLDNLAIPFSYANSSYVSASDTTVPKRIGGLAMTSVGILIPQNFGQVTTIVSGLGLPFKCLPDRNELYGIVEITGTPTP